MAECDFDFMDDEISISTRLRRADKHLMVRRIMPFLSSPAETRILKQAKEELEAVIKEAKPSIAEGAKHVIDLMDTDPAKASDYLGGIRIQHDRETRDAFLEAAQSCIIRQTKK